MRSRHESLLEQVASDNILEQSAYLHLRLNYAYHQQINLHILVTWNSVQCYAIQQENLV